MTSDGVDGDEMDGMNDMDDATAEALIAGLGRDADAVLTDLLGDMRFAYRSQPPVMGAALASFVAGHTSPQSAAKRRIPKMRSLLTAKVAAIAASIVAGTGGLAVAGALPSPVRSVMSGAASHVGLNLPGHASHHALDVTSSNSATNLFRPKSSDDLETPTSTPDGVTPEPTDPPEACSGDSNDSADSKDGTEAPDSETTVPTTDTPTSVPCPPPTSPTIGHDGSDDQNQSGDNQQSDGQNRGSQSGTSHDGDQNSGSQSGTSHDGGQSGSSGGDQTTSTTSDSGN